MWYFPYTGHSIQGAFLAYYKAHGGVAVFGAPRTEDVNVDGNEEQFFSDQVLNYDSTLRAVVPQRLGFVAVPTPEWLTRVPRVKNKASQRFFPQTGHTVTNRFLEFFLAHGGVRTFGYPITEKRYEGGTLVQYFENAELVWRDDPNGYVYTGPLGLRSLVELGLITGDNLPPALHAPFASPARTPAFHPTLTATRRPTATPMRFPTLTPTMHPTSTPSRTATLPPTYTPAT